MRSSLGALIGIALTAVITHLALGPSSALPFLLAPMGASAVLLFGVPASPLAQPWSLIGGNTLSALIGVTCSLCIADQVTAAALAIAFSIAAMFALRCVHPPSGAVALTAVLGGASIHAMGYRFVLLPVGINSLALLASAIAYHRLTRHRYPHRSGASVATRADTEQDAFNRADLDAVLRSRNEVLDIDAADLQAVLEELQTRTYRRHLQDLRCAGVMAVDVRYVTAETSAQVAWEILHGNKIKAIPVVDGDRRVVGILTQMDFIQHATAHNLVDLARYRRMAGRRAAPLVGELMSSPVKTAQTTQPLADLVPLFARSGHHHLPVVDADGRLAGMVTQANLVRGLHRQALGEVAAAVTTTAGKAESGACAR